MKNKNSTNGKTNNNHGRGKIRASLIRRVTSFREVKKLPPASGNAPNKPVHLKNENKPGGAAKETGFSFRKLLRDKTLLNDPRTTRIVAAILLFATLLTAIIPSAFGARVEGGNSNFFTTAALSDQFLEAGKKMLLPSAAVTETNFALGQPATMTTTNYGGTPDKAVDGNTDGNYSNNSVTHTNTPGYNWWQVDLGQSRQINRIKVWNRTDDNFGALSKFYVMTSDTPFTDDDPTVAATRPGTWYAFNGGPAAVQTEITVNRSARYVRVQLGTWSHLTLAEVEVLGDPNATPVPNSPVVTPTTPLGAFQAGCETLDGWAYDQANPSVRLPVTIFADYQPYKTLTADQFRQDVLSAGHGDGYSGFQTYTKKALKDGTTRPVVAYAGSYQLPANTNAISCGTYVTLNLSATTVPAGGTVSVGWVANISRPNTDSLNVFAVGAPNTAALSSQHVNQTAPGVGTETVTMPTTPGQYEIRYFVGEELESYATSQPITVTGGSSTPTPTPTITPTPTPTVTPTPGTYINYALNQPATQIHSNYGGTPDKAVDGNTDGIYSHGSSTHTERTQASSWWQVDLGQTRQIDKIRVWNNIDNLPERLTDFNVIVSNTPFISDDLLSTINQPGVWSTHFPGTGGRPTEFNVNQAGRYVRIQLTGSEYLSLAEVEVLGNPNNPPTPTGNTASFVRRDMVTGGNWTGAYGAQGYQIAEDATNLPTWAQVGFTGQLNYIWAASTFDARALKKAANNNDRIASSWYTPVGGTGANYSTSFNFTDGQEHQLSLYSVDWDSYGPRRQQFEVLDGASGAVLDTKIINSFGGGIYTVWKVKGQVVVKVTNLANGSTAVISGIFIDAPNSPAPVTNNTASFVKTDTTTQGNWTGSYGGQGFKLVGDVTNLPAWAQISLSGNGEYTWPSNPGDARFLTKASNPSERLATTWYSAYGYIDIPVNFTDGQEHQVSIYSANIGAQEHQLQVMDAANGNILDIRFVDTTSPGVYMSWQIKGNVVIRVLPRINFGGISGIFIDGQGGSSPTPTPTVTPTATPTITPTPTVTPTATPTITPTPTPTATPTVTPTPQATTKLAKEYIYAGSRMLAIEDYGLTPAPPPPTVTPTPTLTPTPTPPTPTPTPVLKPDLVISSFTITPGAPVEGDAVNFSVTVTNQGAGTMSGFLGVRYTVDGQCPAGGCPSHAVSSLNLAPNQSATLTGASATWAATLGGHTLGAQVDDVNSVDESDESNNTSSLTINVGPAPKPDLVLTSFTASPSDRLVAGDAVNFTAVFTNQGNAATPNANIAINYLIDGVAQNITAYSTISVAPNQSVTYSVMNQPWTAAAGSHTITAVLDNTDAVTESNEGNNTATTSLNVNAVPTISPTDYFQVVANHSSKCLEVAGGPTAVNDATALQQWDCIGASATNQLWSFVQVGNTFQMIAKNSGKCADVIGGPTALNDGAGLHQYSCFGASAPNQLWKLIPVNGSYQLVAKHSDKCLDVPASSGNNGAAMQQWTCGSPGQANQTWTLVPVQIPPPTPTPSPTETPCQRQTCPPGMRWSFDSCSCEYVAELSR